MQQPERSSEVTEVEETCEYKKSLGYFIIKRVIDVIGSLSGVILISPVMIIVAIWIKIDSKGPVFFAQSRVGRDGKKFMMYKFRSMCSDAECLLGKLKNENEMSGPMFKMKDDPRITKVGKFVRKTSIDELPQLFNILKGEMSLVGPRPSLPKEVVQFTSFQKRRLIAKPGLTCYWQVRGRSDISFEEWMEMDVEYIEERNTWIDIILIFKTVGVLFGDEGAR
ncbi:exopolysaccharide biosynthesis polyprenyl glycosylphosphotransferase [Clostridium estertheticum]|uniref:sugar transferase n=1 Tax=Clostridium estertheticum TaxID=238834 RepID=UPI001CF1DAA8|nr:sugar transferase [Clostridium estertheticum]MCB2306809.1 exopolysaccharide biosynthesis polyprenyl glycosylphosphotransferase [Clostridium estertheticum]MCB2347020.1 exopolysaccharide biosynthesis polyprenyl glycosylphosphotransferase [Clostridium estertheticum]MCB2350315.1 exopolysaccharide biosynthesis polyprenyl glycosylphosphotransferase [Clostridium estertheticum]WAG47282.1 exopolysaccharide biosynthesis polyprenyl glycosylphosphotransferase [Clostridium estertheticum]